MQTIPQVLPSVPSAPTLADRLEGAAALIEERGWRQGAYTDPSGRLCLMGAVVMACVGSVSQEAALVCRYQHGDALNHYMNAALDTVPTRVRAWEWNDAPGRTQGEVVALLRRAAALARPAPASEETR